jgi:pimeloyl-ACP methyl ester carboxylesterase
MMADRTYRILDRPEVLAILFYPRREVGVPRLTAGTHSVRIPVADGVEVGGRVFAAGANAPVILYFHGNGEIAADYDSIAPWYTRIGLTLFVIDYRGYGRSDGAPTASALIEDAWTCYGKAREVLGALQLAPRDVYVMGRSLGSAAALEIASRARDGIKGLIIESGFAYTFALIERIGFLQVADALEQRDGFGNLDKIARVTAPTLIIHGERDWLIPIADAELLFEASLAKDKTLLRVPGAGHNDLMLVGRGAYFEAIAKICGTAPAP